MLNKIPYIKGATNIFDLSQVHLPQPVNLHGNKGIKCMNCGGWGYTILLTTKKPIRCQKCNYTGVEPIPTIR